MAKRKRETKAKPRRIRQPSPVTSAEVALRARVLGDEQLDQLHQVVGARVRQAREELGLSQEQCARALGRTQHWLSGLESGIHAAQLYVLVPLAAASGRSLGWFVGEPDRR